MNAAKTALITGAASGIGLECARELGRAGIRLVLWDRSEQVHSVALELRSVGVDAQAVSIDLSDIEATMDAADQHLSLGMKIDILVNNAGIHPKTNGLVQELQKISLDDWEQVFRVNTTAPFLLCQKFIGGMAERKWGRIINIASRAGRSYSARAGTHYSASKAAVIGMTRKIAGDFGGSGITANCIAPGQIETPLARTSAPEVLIEAARRIPAGRLGTVAEIASAIAFLASDAASFINGTVIDINGGETMA